MNKTMQFKARMKNLALKNRVSAQSVLQNFMLERLLERISTSMYKDRFILTRTSRNQRGSPRRPPSTRRFKKVSQRPSRASRLKNSCTKNKDLTSKFLRFFGDCAPKKRRIFQGVGVNLFYRFNVRYFTRCGVRSFPNLSIIIVS